MKTYKPIFMIALALMTVISCTPASDEELALIPDSESINASETVTFTVLYGETDVTDLAKIFLRSTNEELADNTFSTSIPGEYEFFATYNDAQSEYVKVRVNESAVLSVDKNSIAPDGIETATFTVTRNGTDITGESTLYLLPEEGNPMAQEGFTFTTTEAGVYTFYATAGGISTNSVQIIVLPTDSEPANFNFRQRGLITEFTGTWCGFCAMIKAAVHNLEASGYDNGYPVEIHSGDMMALEYSGALDELFRVNSTGYPTTAFQLDRKTALDGVYSQTDIQANTDRIKELLEGCLDEYECTSGISGAYFSDETGKMKVSATVKIADDGEYRIAAWLLENNIHAEQSNYTANVVNTEEVSVHRNVLRAVSNSTEFTGDDVTAGAMGTQGFEWTFDESSLLNGNPEDSHVLIFVTKKQEGGVYIVNNIIRCGFEKVTGFEYAE